MNDNICIEDASILLNDGFKKILKVNISADKFFILALGDDEMATSGRFSDWIHIFSEEGNIPDKAENDEFDLKMSNNYMQNFFDNDQNSRYAFRYHRRTSRGTSEYVECSVTRSVEYTIDEPIVIVCVKHIDDYEDMKFRSEYDSMTKVRNRWSYDTFVANNNTRKTDVGIIYADLNDLKKINDSEGHVAGDRLIKEFSEILTSHFRHADTYRVGGDEFVIIAENIPNYAFYSKFSEMLFDLGLTEINVAIGVYYMVNGIGVDGVQEAERRMYEDKRRKKGYV